MNRTQKSILKATSGALLLGAVAYFADPAALWARLGGASVDPLVEGIVWDLRMPRIVTAALVGAGLGVAGVVMQAVTRNPLADPYLLGVSSGASLGAVAVLLLWFWLSGLSVLLGAEVNASFAPREAKPNAPVDTLKDT